MQVVLLDSCFFYYLRWYTVAMLTFMTFSLIVTTGICGDDAKNRDQLMVYHLQQPTGTHITTSTVFYSTFNCLLVDFPNQ